MQLFGDLLDNGIITPGNQGKARNSGLKGLCHTETFNIIATTAEQTSHPRQYPRFILQQNRYCMTFHIFILYHSRQLNTKFISQISQNLYDEVVLVFAFTNQSASTVKMRRYFGKHFCPL